jgi:lantibiotic leader peptide-processing serine protease
MRRSASLPVVLLLGGFLAGCADQTVAPAGPLAPPAAQLNKAAGFSASGNQMVVFTTAVPDDFSVTVEDLGGRVLSVFDQIGVAVVTGLDDTGARTLRKAHGVQYVEPEPMFTVGPVGEPQLQAMDATPASPSDPTAAYFYARQWNMLAIHADEAWAAGRLGSADVTVGILDSGLDYENIDLKGLVDLSRSASFVGGDYKDSNGLTDDDYVAMYFPGANPIADIGFHGTHVGATVSSNGMLAAGVTSHVTLIGAKICSVALGYCPGGAITAGLLFAVDQGADVINLSLGSNLHKSEYPGYTSIVNRLFNYANQHGVTIVVAAGNEAIDLDHDGDLLATLCQAANAICVSATGPTDAEGVNGPWTDVDAPAPYSNYGRSSIDVAAPGGNAGGSVWATCSQFSLLIPVCQTGYYVVGATGTSMAAPHVTGIAALLVEQYGRNPGRIKAALQQTADDLGQAGTDPFYGKGRVNAARAAGAM